MEQQRKAAQDSKSGVPALDDLRVVLVRTQHPGNIGAAARAMKTMGVHDLALVSPSRSPDEQSFAMASGAADVLDRARIFDTLSEAVADCAHVVGVSARRRGISLIVNDARNWAGAWATGTGRTALVFGAERTGLTNAELALCQEAVQIPANPEYSSLNLAQAVQVLCYECRMAAITTPAYRSGHKPADHGAMEGLYAHLEATLIQIGFLNPDHPRHLMRRLRRLGARARPDAVEANILRGILSAVQEDKGRHG